jgi:hypothetical protein
VYGKRYHKRDQSRWNLKDMVNLAAAGLAQLIDVLSRMRSIGHCEAPVTKSQTAKAGLAQR